MEAEIAGRLDRLESLLPTLVERQSIKEFYDIAVFARLVSKEAVVFREECGVGLEDV